MRFRIGYFHLTSDFVTPTFEIRVRGVALTKSKCVVAYDKSVPLCEILASLKASCQIVRGLACVSFDVSEKIIWQGGLLGEKAEGTLNICSGGFF